MNSYGFMLWTIFLLAGSGAACLAWTRHYKAQAAQMFQNVLQILDEAAAGRVSETVYDESIDAAITERLNRVVQISQMHQQSAEKERDTVKSLISDISHQVRTPLTNIMLYTGLLKEMALGSDAVLLVEKLQKQSDKLDFFMKELVKSSYAEQEMIKLCPGPSDIFEIIQTACQAVELAAMKKEIVLRHVPGKEPVEGFCCCDKKWTVEALGNVLENAVKYSPDGSVIEIEVIPFDSFLCIQVKDEGIGIKEEELGLVYGRFYRSKDVKDTAGFGIGLYLVREVLSRQGGYSKIKSQPGKGTAVQMFLPRYSRE